MAPRKIISAESLFASFEKLSPEIKLEFLELLARRRLKGKLLYHLIGELSEEEMGNFFGEIDKQRTNS